MCTRGGLAQWSTVLEDSQPLFVSGTIISYKTSVHKHSNAKDIIGLYIYMKQRYYQSLIVTWFQFL